jgi:hypothetical protein
LLTLASMSVNDNPSDSESPYRPGGLVAQDFLPPDARPGDFRRFVLVSLRVIRPLLGNHAVVVQCEDLFRGSCVMPMGWIKPYQPNREPKHGTVYRFSIPIDRWSEKRRQLLSLQIRRRAEGVDGPHDAA